MTAREAYHDSVLAFDEGSHTYTLDGVVVPGVTSILSVIDKPALRPWVAKMCGEYLASRLRPGKSLDEIEINNLIRSMKKSWRRISRDAADIGTIVHGLAERFTAGDPPPPPVNLKARASYEAFLAWWNAHSIEVHETEFMVCSRRHKFAGTCDLDCTLDGARTLLDYKTSKGIWPEYWLQLAAYHLARTEENPRQYYEQLAVARFDKATGEFELVTQPVSRVHEAGFLSALGVWKWQQEMKKK